MLISNGKGIEVWAKYFVGKVGIIIIISSRSTCLVQNGHISPNVVCAFSHIFLMMLLVAKCYLNDIHLLFSCSESGRDRQL